MKAYKGFNKGLTCRGYQFKADEVNVTKEANCVRNGFHCAENPLDCVADGTGIFLNEDVLGSVGKKN